jgi:antitoxin MazE
VFEVTTFPIDFQALTGITPEDMREAFDWGPDVGREVVD